MAKPRTATAPFLDKWVTQPVQYTQRDLLLYAQGIGCTELPFTYEHADDGFHAFPTFPIVLSFTGMDQDVVSFPSEVRPLRICLKRRCCCCCAPRFGLTFLLSFVSVFAMCYSHSCLSNTYPAHLTDDDDDDDDDDPTHERTIW